MDERLEKAYSYANFKIAQNAERDLMKLKFANSLKYSKHGGVFTISIELINFINSVTDESVILLDDNQIPILITNVLEFKEEITSTYFESLNSYYTQYEEFRKKRNIKSLLEN